MVKVGERYIGWGKTWLVTKVSPEGVVDAYNVDNPANTIKWPIEKFKTEAKRTDK